MERIKAALALNAARDYALAMPETAFSHVEYWVFDLDDTLYPVSARLFELIEARMGAWVARTLGLDLAAAHALRHQYWRTYGTTLAGLMAEHGIDPDPYLADVHAIALDALQPDPLLRARIAALPGRRIIYTNGTATYAERVLAARGLSGLFDGIYGVIEAGYHPKPQRVAFETIFARDRLDPTRAAMFEDDPRNLAVPHALGMQTVHVAPDPAPAPHIHHHTADLTAFLGRLQPSTSPAASS